MFIVLETRPYLFRVWTCFNSVFLYERGASNLLRTRNMLIEWNFMSMKLIQSYLYTTSVTFLFVIVERMLGSRWDLLQNHYVFVPVLCVSNFLRPQQKALSGTCLHRTGMGTTCTCGPLYRHTSHDFFLWDYLNKGCTGINLAPWRLWRVII